MTASRSHGAEQGMAGDAPDAKVHIFNFRAWFYADPVKAALTLGSGVFVMVGHLYRHAGAYSGQYRVVWILAHVWLLALQS